MDTKYKQIKQELNSLRTELINYITAHESEQDLMDKFIKVKEHDESTYELILLVYQELKTTHKINKRKLVSILDKTIELKLLTIEQLIENDKHQCTINDEKEDEEKEDKNIYEKIFDALTFKNIVRGVLLWLFVFVSMFTMYNINATAFEKTNTNMWDTVEKTKEILK